MIGGLWQRTLKPPTVSVPSYGGYCAAKLQIKHANQQSGNSPIRVHSVTSQRLRRLHWSPKGSGACRSMEDPG